MKSKEYFSKCCTLVDDDVFAAFFPELLALLPDIRKQEVGRGREVKQETKGEEVRSKTRERNRQK